MVFNEGGVVENGVIFLREYLCPESSSYGYSIFFGSTAVYGCHFERLLCLTLTVFDCLHNYGNISITY